jgi:hypothetical protein
MRDLDRRFGLRCVQANIEGIGNAPGARRVERMSIT